MKQEKPPQKRPSKKPLDIEELLASSQPLWTESFSLSDDLPYVIVSVAFLESSLRTLLSQLLIKGETSNDLLDFKGALGSFKAKTDLAYALGLIPLLLFQNLGKIGEIRNKFAHSHPTTSFENDDVIVMLEGVVIPELYNFWSDDFSTGGSGYRHWFSTFKGMASEKGRKKFEAAIKSSYHVLHSLLVSPKPIARRLSLHEDREGKNKLDP